MKGEVKLSRKRMRIGEGSRGGGRDTNRIKRKKKHLMIERRGGRK